MKANSALSERISPTASGLAPDRRRIPENWWGIILMAPAILLIAGLVLYPVLYSMWLSLHAKHAYLPIQRFIGFENFKFFLLEDEEFWRALKLGSIFTFGSLTLQIVIGIGAALVLNETFVGRGFVRAVTLFPYMLPTIVVVILMRWIFNDSYGIAKYLIQSSGLTQTPIVWFSSGMVMITLIMVSTWTFFPFVVIGTLSRLQTIDPELYAAAKVDGAGIFRRFYHITLPQLRSVIFVVVLLRFMFMFTKFDLVWLFAGAGGVGYFVRTLPIYTYLKTFGEMQVGAGAALSTMMFVMLGVFAFAYFTFFRREEHL
ncbi:sugar ABC transporter permease [Bradyrhizobium sp. dw_411]|uniref:carbohydrate ABC transporter permease n=1 Tax=Bradyrhizobium sp. dw_411 TaxID=2720082 RepID=UPI001BCFB63A|nr:sugar ABC transporter permease [Bradyrhizobium sp. dw_411]